MAEKISISKLRLDKLLDWARAGGAIEIAKLLFEERGCVQMQSDNTSTVGVIMVIKPSFFTKYHGIGDVVIDLNSSVKQTRSSFKDDKDIDIWSDKNQIYFNGEREQISRVLLDQKVTEIRSKIKQTDYGAIPNEMAENNFCVAIIDAAELKGISAPEKVEFVFGESGVTIKVRDEHGTYSKNLKVGTLVGYNSEEVPSGSILTPSRMLSDVVGVLNGPVTFMLSENLPMLITTISKEYRVTYMLNTISSSGE